MIKPGNGIKTGQDQQTSVAPIELPDPPVFSVNREGLNLKGSAQDRVAGYIDALPYAASAPEVCSLLIDMAKISLAVGIAAASHTARKDHDPDRVIGAINALRYFGPGEAIKIALERLSDPTMAARVGRVLYDIDPVLALAEFEKLARSDLLKIGEQMIKMFA